MNIPSFYIDDIHFIASSVNKYTYLLFFNIYCNIYIYISINMFATINATINATYNNLYYLYETYHMSRLATIPNNMSIFTESE